VERYHGARAQAVASLYQQTIKKGEKPTAIIRGEKGSRR